MAHNLRQNANGKTAMRPEFKEPIVALKCLRWLAKHAQNRVWSLNWTDLSTENKQGRK